MLQYHSNMVTLRLTYYTLQLKSHKIFGASPCPEVWTIGFPKTGCNEETEAYHQPDAVLLGRFLCRHLVQVVRPPLHHLPPLGQILGVVVGSLDSIALYMGKLDFNHLGPKAMLV